MKNAVSLILIFMMLGLYSCLAFTAEAPVEMYDELEFADTWLMRIEDFLFEWKNVLLHIASWIGANALLKLPKTKKPMSILIGVQKFFESLAVITPKVLKIIAALMPILDRIFAPMPQRLKDDKSNKLS